MRTKHSVDQRGMVSIMITLIMMLVISLIVVGFAQVSNRNRREALDRQLSMQAFYAAESGVNAAVSTIRAALAAGTTVAAQDQCTDSEYYNSSSAKLVDDGSVAYTCVLVNPRVSKIVTPANLTEPAIVPINTVDNTGAPVQASSLTLSWSPPDGGVPGTTGCLTTGTFPVNGIAYTCAFGVLRVDLFKLDGTSVSSAANLAGSTATFYLKPTTSGSGLQDVSSFTTPKAYVVNASYDTSSGMYRATINFNAPAAHYYARITTLYKPAKTVEISSSNGTYFADAQATVDVTGRAQDVLRRVQVRVPLQDYNSTLPVAAVQSGNDVCKRFAVSPTTFDNTSGGYCGP